MDNLPIDILEDVLFRLSVEVALEAKSVCTTWEAILGSKFTDHDYMIAKTLQAEAGQFLFTSYNQVFGNFDSMGLQENLLRGIYAYGSRMPSGIQQRGVVPFWQGLDVIERAQTGRVLRVEELLLGLPTQKPKSSSVNNEVSHSSQCHKHIFRDRNRRINKRKDVWKRKL